MVKVGPRSEKMTAKKYRSIKTADVVRTVGVPCPQVTLLPLLCPTILQLIALVLVETLSRLYGGASHFEAFSPRLGNTKLHEIAGFCV